MHRLITTTWVCVLGLMMSSQHCHAGPGLTFKATPGTIKIGLTKTGHMRCEVSASSIAHVSSMVVTFSRGHHYVASVSDNRGAKAFMTRGDLSVTGSVSGKGFISLTWNKPSQMPIGKYTCEVTARSKSNRRVKMESAVTMTAVTPSNLELAQQLDKQTRKLDQQTRKLAICSQNVAFDAVLPADTTFGGGKTVVYSRVLTNVGNAYSSTSGLFTCSVPGIYRFNVHAMSVGGSSKYARLDMVLNSKRVASLLAGYESTRDSSSMSAVLDLKPGDVVRVKAIANSQLENHDRDHNNVFNGELIHATGC